MKGRSNRDELHGLAEAVAVRGRQGGLDDRGAPGRDGRRVGLDDRALPLAVA